MKNKMQFIYFDIGGVAILDYSKTNKWNEMLNDLSVTEDLKSRFYELFDAHEKKICVGEDINIFVQEAKTKLGIKFPDNYDMTADFVDRFEKNPSMIELLKKLKNGFKLGLLTAQYPNMLDMIFKRGLLSSDIWDVIIDSSVEKVNKPNPDIYLLAEKRAGVKPESILFVDNKAKLLEFPKQRGWITFEYDPANAKQSTADLEKLIFN